MSALASFQRDYDQKYAKLPDPIQQTEYLARYYGVNIDAIKKKIEEIERIGWKEMRFEFSAVPKPTPRARYSSVSNCFYVKGASTHKALMKSKLDEYEVIHTATEFMVLTFSPIPTSQMTSEEILLAQLGYIRPIKDPDWDNVGKTYSDMTNDLLIANDNCIINGQTIKYYSIKPRVVVYIRYQDDFDSDYNRKLVTESKSYKRLCTKRERKCLADGNTSDL